MPCLPFAANPATRRCWNDAYQWLARPGYNLGVRQRLASLLYRVTIIGVAFVMLDCTKTHERQADAPSCEQTVAKIQAVQAKDWPETLQAQMISICDQDSWTWEFRTCIEKATTPTGAAMCEWSRTRARDAGEELDFQMETTLRHIGRNASKYYETHGSFPDSIGLTPLRKECCQEDDACGAAPQLWDSPTWQALEVKEYGPHYASFSFTSSADGFVATAIGDRGCAGELSTYRVTGHIVDGELVSTKQVEKDNAPGDWHAASKNGKSNRR